MKWKSFAREFFYQKNVLTTFYSLNSITECRIWPFPFFSFTKIRMDFFLSRKRNTFQLNKMLILSNGDEDCVTKKGFLLIRIFHVTLGLLQKNRPWKKKHNSVARLVLFRFFFVCTMQLVSTKCICFLKPLCAANRIVAFNSRCVFVRVHTSAERRNFSCRVHLSSTLNSWFLLKCCAFDCAFWWLNLFIIVICSVVFP